MHLNHLTTVDWIAFGYAACVVLCALKLWPRR